MPTRRPGIVALTALAALGVAPAGAAGTPASPHAHTTARASEIDWQTSPLDLDLRGMNGERYAFHCPPGKPLPHRVAGSGPYTDDSSICTAAVHAGVIRPKDGGDVTIEIRPGLSRYDGSDRNYIASADYAGRWDGSFVIVHRDVEGTPWTRG
jgi:LCCL domain